MDFFTLNAGLVDVCTFDATVSCFFCCCGTPGLATNFGLPWFLHFLGPIALCLLEFFGLCCPPMITFLRLRGFILLLCSTSLVIFMNLDPETRLSTIEV